MKFPFAFRPNLFILSILQRQIICLQFPTTSSALRKAISQVDEHFIFAVWTVQGDSHLQKGMSLIFINQPSKQTIYPELIG